MSASAPSSDPTSVPTTTGAATGASQPAASPDITLAELESLLQQHHIDTSRFVKTTKDLHEEVKNQESFLETEAGKLVRVVTPIFIVLRCRIGSAGGIADDVHDHSVGKPTTTLPKYRVLCNTKDIYKHRNNMERVRDSVVSEKLFPGETPLVAALRGLREELLLSEADIDYVVGTSFILQYKGMKLCGDRVHGSLGRGGNYL